MSEIVVGYDGSATARIALDEALALAKDLGDRLVIVFGYAPPGTWGGEIVEHEKAIEELGEKAANEARQRAEAEGVPFDVALVAKHGADALIEVADERDARMIVVGSHGETTLKELILGATPQKLLHTSQRPVLVVPTGG
jgi:nucleotide-binding universal stress UspA family protein